MGVIGFIFNWFDMFYVLSLARETDWQERKESREQRKREEREREQRHACFYGKWFTDFFFVNRFPKVYTIFSGQTEKIFR
jgi:hypothetical protein